MKLKDTRQNVHLQMKKWCQHAAHIPAHSIWSSWSTPFPQDSYRWSPPSHCTPLPSSCSPALLPWHSGSRAPSHRPATTVKWVVRYSLLLSRTRGRGYMKWKDTRQNVHLQMKKWCLPTCSAHTTVSLLLSVSEQLEWFKKASKS